MAQVGAKAAEFIDNIESCTPEERVKMLQSLNEMLLESLRQGEEKVALATAAYDVVRSCSCSFSTDRPCHLDFLINLEVRYRGSNFCSCIDILWLWLLRWIGMSDAWTMIYKSTRMNR